MAILRRDCPHCPTAQVAFEIRWNEAVRRQPVAWKCAAVCGACDGVICFVAIFGPGRQNVAPMHSEGNIEPIWLVQTIWPSPAETSAPAHTPGAVARRFVQGENAFRRSDWNAAVAMYRSALDIATKGMDGVPAGSFYERLQWLHGQHRITPDMRDWADHVRVEGNVALHDPEEFTEQDAKPLRLFAETFLRYVFELPGEVRSFREGPPQPAGQAADA